MQIRPLLIAASLGACARAPATLEAPEPVDSGTEARGESAARLAESAQPKPSCPGPRYRLDLAGATATLVPIDGAPALDRERIEVVIADDLDGDGDLDHVLSLGRCGNWGECIHAVLLGCGGSGLATLASEPDLYAYGFTREARDDGPPLLWELTRTAIAGDDELGRVRWELGGENTARRTHDYVMEGSVR